MFRYEVGQLFKEGVTHYQEGIRFDFTQEGPIVLLYFSNPTNEEIQDIKTGNSKIAYFKKEDVIFMLFKFGNMEWMDAPYNVHLSKSFELETPQGGQGYALNIFLIDAANGKIQAMRLIGLQTEFSLKLKAAIEKQAKMEFNKEQYFNNINTYYRYFNTRDMVRLADAKDNTEK